jgi:folate-binding protein YgfZ
MLIERPLVAVLPETRTARVTGRHRTRFLHAMTTADVSKMAPGASGFALMATSTGRHIGQMRLEVGADTITLAAYRHSLAAILEGLKKHRIADDVRWEEETPSATLAIYGASAREVVARTLPDQAETVRGLVAGRFETCEFEGAELRIVAISEGESDLGRETLHVRTAPEHLPHLRVRLLAAGAEPLDERDWNRMRIEAGWPLDGIDVGEEDVALASERLGGTVSWNKGCFLGQEVYVMARDRGELPKRLRGLVISGGEVPPRAELKDSEGRVAGIVGSCSPTPDGHIALAMMKRKHSEPGTRVVLPDGREARVQSLPLGTG